VAADLFEADAVVRPRRAAERERAQAGQHRHCPDRVEERFHNPPRFHLVVQVLSRRRRQSKQSILQPRTPGQACYAGRRIFFQRIGGKIKKDLLKDFSAPRVTPPVGKTD
jgi:hypothetical protein